MTDKTKTTNAQNQNTEGGKSVENTEGGNTPFLDELPHIDRPSARRGERPTDERGYFETNDLNISDFFY
jgi:hypothetical protein